MAKDIKEFVQVIFAIIVVVLIINAISQDYPDAARIAWYVLIAFAIGAAAYFRNVFWNNR